MVVLLQVVQLLGFLYSGAPENSIRKEPGITVYIPYGSMDMSEQIAGIFKSENVKTIVFRGSIVIDKVVNVPTNRVLRFEAGSSITGSGTVNGGIIEADYHQQIFDTALTVNPQEKDSVFSVKWYGAKGDGVTDDREVIRKTFEMTRRQGGGNVLIPEGVYKVSRRQALPHTIIEVYSNTRVRGEGMKKTMMKLDPDDMLNFRRIFLLGSKSEITENIEISDMAFDLSNPFTTYPPPKSFGNDAQSSAIFCYSDSFDVRNIYLHDLLIQNVPGDIIGVSSNSKNVTIERIYQKNYLRQGISIGGSKGVDSITVKHIYDLPFTDAVVKGGNSIHTEPYHLVKNVSYSFCNILDFSASGIDGLLVDSVVTTSGLRNSCNDVSNFVIRNSVLKGRLQVSPTGPGIVERNVLNDGIYVTSVGGVGFRDVSGIEVRSNTIIDTLPSANIRVNQVNGVSVYDNYIKVDTSAIVFSNAKSGKILNNRIWVNNPSSFAIAVYSTIKARYGEGPYIIDGNSIYGTNKGIKATHVLSEIGENNSIHK
ncbi:MAG: hypothetical protein KIT80_05570 [Chitinophagaceae bacterium]|nr:hypothetical protein [Chitinophagaceae bacterium]MCW5926365.1 hypothetical protein [Chitinophagaceae bacterium]